MRLPNASILNPLLPKEIMHWTADMMTVEGNEKLLAEAATLGELWAKLVALGYEGLIL